MKELWRRTRWPIALLSAYALFWTLLLLALPEHGLVTPDGKLHLPSAILTGVVLILRLLALFVLTPLLVFRAVTWPRA